jgi:hypothetical protein
MILSKAKKARSRDRELSLFPCLLVSLSQNPRVFASLRLFVSILLLLVCFGIPVSSAQPLLDQPTIENGSFRSGEVLKYSVKVRGIPAGTQTMQVNGKRLLNGYEVYHVESVSKASSFFNIFYSFSSRSESFIHSKKFHPLLYRKKIRDGGYRGSTAVDFDQANQVAKVVKDKKRTELHVPAGIQDELSMIYLLRTKEIEVGQKYEFPALIGTKALEANVVVLRTEKLKTALGTLKTIVVKAIPKDITMWLTNDSARIPVRIEASTKVGRLVSNLEEMR